MKNKNNKGKLKVLLVITIFTLLIVNFSNFIKAEDEMRMVLINPQAYLTGEINTNMSYSVGAVNKNNYPINVHFGEPELGMMYYIDSLVDFELQPGETITLEYLYTPIKTGLSKISIPVIFKSSEKTFTLTQNIVIFVNEEDKNTSTLFWFLVVVLIIMIFVFVTYSIAKRLK